MTSPFYSICRCLTCPLALIINLFVWPAVSDAQVAPKPSVREIQDALERRQRSISSAIVTWDEDQTLSAKYVALMSLEPQATVGFNSPEGKSGDIVFRGVRSTISLSSNKTRYESTSVSFYGDTKGQQVPALNVFDGKVRQAFTPKGVLPHNRGYVRKMADSEESNMIYTIPLFLAFRPLAPPVLGGRLENYVIDAQGMDVDGHRCVVLRENPVSPNVCVRTIWLDSKRNYLPLRRTESLSGQIVNSIQIQYKEDEQVEWVPSTWKTSMTTGDGSLLLGTEATVVEYAVNPSIPDRQFTIDFPVGTLISDTGKGGVTNGEYIVTNNGRWVPYVGQTVEEASGYSWWLLIVSGLIVAALVVGVAIWRSAQ